MNLQSLFLKQQSLKILFEKFDSDPKLGVASGVCFITLNGKIVEEKHPRFHTRGPLKTYRTKCFKDIGGLLNCLGWDAIDEFKANMLKWNSQSFPELKINHLKKTQSAGGIFKGSLNKGIAAYNSGFHPLYVIARAVYIFYYNRYKSESVGLILGYFKSVFQFKPRPIDKKLMKYIRKQQINRFLGKKSILK